MYPNPQDVLPLPPRPSLEQYKKQAKELARACKARPADAIREWAARWPDHAEPLAVFARDTLTRRDCALTGAQFVIARAHGFEPRVSFAAEQWLSKQGLVAAGVGVTLIPGLAIASVRDDIVLRSLGPHGPRRRVVVLLPAGYRAPAVEPFVALLHHEAAEHAAALDERARRIGATAEATA